MACPCKNNARVCVRHVISGWEGRHRTITGLLVVASPLARMALAPISTTRATAAASHVRPYYSQQKRSRRRCGCVRLAQPQPCTVSPFVTDEGDSHDRLLEQLCKLFDHFAIIVGDAANFGGELPHACVLRVAGGYMHAFEL